MPPLLHRHTRRLYGRTFRLAASSTLVAALAACGGGGGGTAGQATQAPTILTGTAATGAPMAGARLTVYDRNGALIANAVVNDKGLYQVVIPANAQAPLLVVARNPDDDTAQVSVLASLELGQENVANVTQITSLIAARLSVDGTPQGLRIPPSAESVDRATADVMSVIGPLARRIEGQTMTHPVTGEFDADGTGHDLLLDSLAVTFTPRYEDASNIEVLARVTGTQNGKPWTQFVSNQPVTELPVGENVRTITPGTMLDVNELVDLMNQCYAPGNPRLASNPAIV